MADETQEAETGVKPARSAIGANEQNNDLTEVIARIVDPDEWSRFDTYKGRYTPREYEDTIIAPSLAKAGSILKAITLRSSGGVELGPVRELVECIRWGIDERDGWINDPLLVTIRAHTTVLLEDTCLQALSISGGGLGSHLAKDALPRGETHPDTPSLTVVDLGLAVRLQDPAFRREYFAAVIEAWAREAKAQDRSFSVAPVYLTSLANDLIAALAEQQPPVQEQSTGASRAEGEQADQAALTHPDTLSEPSGEGK